MAKKLTYKAMTAKLEAMNALNAPSIYTIYDELKGEFRNVTVASFRAEIDAAKARIRAKG